MALEPNNKGHARPATTAPSDKPAVPLFPPQERFHSRDQDKENDEKPKNDGHPITRMPPKEERLLQSSWPKEYIRLRYPVVSRKSFGALQLLKPGGLSVVYHATHLATKADMVLKVLMEKDDWNCEMRGYANSKSNPAVVQLIAVMALSATEANQLCQGIKGYVPRESHEDVGVMVFERWDSSLRDAIDAGRVREWGLLTSVGLMKDVARAVAFMHKNDVMHRDIKPDNILFRTIDNKISAGLCDLGLATKVTEKGNQREAFTQGVGTNKYMAPECANGTEYTVAADVYSLAVTMWEVCMAACRLRAQLPEHLSRLMKRGSSTREEDRLDSKRFYIMLKRIYQFLEKKEGKPGGYIDVYQSDTQSDYGGGDRRDKEAVFPEDLLLELSAAPSKRKEEEHSDGSEGKKKRSRSRAKEEQELTTKKRSKREETKEKAKKKSKKSGDNSNKTNSKKRVTKQAEKEEEEEEEEEEKPKPALRRSRRVLERG